MKGIFCCIKCKKGVGWSYKMKTPPTGLVGGVVSAAQRKSSYRV